MLNAEIDLLDGQLSRFDKVPVSYSSPIGQFRGTGYDTKKVPAEPTYEKLSSHKETFLNPKTFSYDTYVRIATIYIRTTTSVCISY